MDSTDSVSTGRTRSRRERAPQNFSEYSDGDSDFEETPSYKSRRAKKEKDTEKEKERDNSGAQRIGPSLIPPSFHTYGDVLVVDAPIPPLAPVRNLVSVTPQGNYVIPPLPGDTRPVPVTCLENAKVYVLPAKAIEDRRVKLLTKFNEVCAANLFPNVPYPKYKDETGMFVIRTITKTPIIPIKMEDNLSTIKSEIKSELAQNLTQSPQQPLGPSGTTQDQAPEQSSLTVKQEQPGDTLTVPASNINAITDPYDDDNYTYSVQYSYQPDPMIPQGYKPSSIEIEQYNIPLYQNYQQLVASERERILGAIRKKLTLWSYKDIQTALNTYGKARGGCSAVNLVSAFYDNKIARLQQTNNQLPANTVIPGKPSWSSDGYDLTESQRSIETHIVNGTAPLPMSTIYPSLHSPTNTELATILLSHAHRTSEPWNFSNIGVQPFTLATYNTLYHIHEDNQSLHKSNPLLHSYTPAIKKEIFQDPAWSLHETIALFDFVTINGTSSWNLIVNDPILRVRHTPNDSEARYYAIVSLSAIYGREPIRMYLNTIIQQNVDTPILQAPVHPNCLGDPKNLTYYARSINKAASNASTLSHLHVSAELKHEIKSESKDIRHEPRVETTMKRPTKLDNTSSTTPGSAGSVILQARLPGQAPLPPSSFGFNGIVAKKTNRRTGKSVFASKNEDEEYFTSVKQANKSMVDRKQRHKAGDISNSEDSQDSDEEGSDEDEESAAEDKPAYRMEKILATKRVLRRVHIKLDGRSAKFLNMDDAILYDQEARERQRNMDKTTTDRTAMLNEMIEIAGDILSDGDDYTIFGEYPEVAIHYEQEPDSTAEPDDYDALEAMTEAQRNHYYEAKEQRRLRRQAEKQAKRKAEKEYQDRILAEKKEKQDRQRCIELKLPYPPPPEIDLVTGRLHTEIEAEKRAKAEADRLHKERREKELQQKEEEERERLEKLKLEELEKLKKQAEHEDDEMNDRALIYTDTGLHHRRPHLNDLGSEDASHFADGLPRALIHVYLIKDQGYSYARAKWFSEFAMKLRYGVRSTVDRLKRFHMKKDEIEAQNLERYDGQCFDPRYNEVDRVLSVRVHPMTDNTLKQERKTIEQLKAITLPPGWSYKVVYDNNNTSNYKIYYKPNNPENIFTKEELEDNEYDPSITYPNPDDTSSLEESTNRGEIEAKVPWSTPSIEPIYLVTMYLVKWSGLGYGQATWEYESDIKNVMKVAQFRRFSLIPSHDKLMDKQWTEHELNVRKLRAQRWYESSPQFRAGHSLRDYQIEGINWLIRCYIQNRNCILADEMGLGKTVQCVAFLEHLRREEGVRGPFMIVAPLSTLTHWKREAEGWTDMNTLVYHDASSGAQGRSILREFEFFYPGTDIVKFNILITSYEMLLSDFLELDNINWKYVIIDEGHRLKNKTAKLMDAFEQLNIPRRLLLTGTPIQNNTTELWTLLNFVEPTKFQSVKDFQSKYKELEEASQVEQLQTTIKPYILRRMKDTVEKSIPPKEETVIDVELTTLQKKYYRAIYDRNSKFLRAGLSASNAPKLINIESELRKVCNHPWLVAGTELKEVPPDCSDQEYFDLTIQASGKLVLLDKLLPKLFADGHRVLIFSQMVMLLDILQDYLRYRKYKFERLDGSITGDQREAAIDRFCRPGSDRFVFLLSTRAGGVGLNLTSADTVIIFDSDWNPQMDVQAQARVHRIGQKSSVAVYRLVTRKTYESQMFAIASKKLGLDHAVLRKLESGGAEHVEDAATLDKILKLGAYGLLDDDEDEQRKTFFNEDIDQILIKNTHVISNKKQNEATAPSGLKLDGKDDSALSTLPPSPRKVGRPSKKQTASVGALVYSKQYFSSEGSESSQIDINDPAFWTYVLGNSSDFKYSADALLSRITDGSMSSSDEARDDFFVDLREGINRSLKKPASEGDNSQLESLDEWIQLLIQLQGLSYTLTDEQRKEVKSLLEDLEGKSNRRSRGGFSDLKFGRKRRRGTLSDDDDEDEDDDDDDEGYGEEGGRRRRVKTPKKPVLTEDGQPRRRGRPPNPNSLKNQRKLAMEIALQNGEIVRRKRGSKPQHNSLVCHACHLPGALVPCDGICNRVWHEECIPKTLPAPYTKGSEPTRFADPVQPPQCILQNLANRDAIAEAEAEAEAKAIQPQTPDYTDKVGHWQCVECLNRTWRCFGCAYTAKMSIEDENDNEDEAEEGNLDGEKTVTGDGDEDPSKVSSLDTTDPVLKSLKQYAKAVRVCSVANCGRVAHLECAKRVQSSRFYGKGAIQKAFRCGAHFCAICSTASEKGDDDEENNDNNENENEDGEDEEGDENASKAKRDGRKENTLLTCISCPTAYHIRCIPSSSIVRLAKRLIYCPNCHEAASKARGNVGRTAIASSEKLVEGRLLRDRRKLPKNIKNALSKQTREERKAKQRAEGSLKKTTKKPRRTMRDDDNEENENDDDDDATDDDDNEETTDDETTKKKRKSKTLKKDEGVKKRKQAANPSPSASSILPPMKKSPSNPTSITAFTFSLLPKAKVGGDDKSEMKD